MDCVYCQKRTASKCSVYDSACLGCCVALVLTARKGKKKAAMLLGTIGWFRAAQMSQIKPIPVPSDDDIMSEVQRLIRDKNNVQDRQGGNTTG